MSLKIVLLATVALLGTTKQICAAERNTGSGDPRCPADFDPLKSCPSSMILPGGAGFNLARSIDPTSCNDQENCPRCLGDDAWQQKMINEIGLYSAVRDANFKPWVVVSNWLSVEITSTIAMILLREAMNISARAAAMPTTGYLEMICCSEPLVNMEQWPSQTTLNDTGINTVTTLPTGYTGQSGLYIPPYTLEKYPLAFTYQAYRLLPDYQHIFPPSFSTACSNMTVNSATGCVSGNYVCETNLWANTTCYDGQWYVPPQCNVADEVGNSSATHCQEVWMADPTYDDGYFEGMIKNNGLNMTGAYHGAVRHISMVKDAVARKEDILFYWYEPDPLITLVGGQMVDFPAVTAECTSQRNDDPTLNTAKCGYPVQVLQKVAQTAALNSHPDYKHFFQSFLFTKEALNALMAQHNTAGGNYSVYDLSCNWVKNNFDTWKGVVQNTPPTAALADSSSSLLSSPGILAVIVVAPTVVVLGVVGVLLWMCCKHRLSLKNAPRTAPLAMIFTDIENSTMLWEACGDDMGTAVEIHHAIIRKHIEEFNAYEVKTIGDSFMIACGSLGDATMLCLAIQTSLGDCKDLPAALRFVPPNAQVIQSKSASSVRMFDEAHDFMESLGSAPTPTADNLSAATPPPVNAKVDGKFHYPLRVRIGLHWCQDVNPRFDRIHGRYDYYGHDVNVCARVEAQAQGGQIMVTAETMEAIIETDEYPIMIAPDVVSAVVKRDVELKGISDRVMLYAMAPLTQVASGYVVSKLLRDESSRGSPGLGSLGGGSIASGGTGMLSTDHRSEAHTRNTKSAVNYATALLRVSFKAVPDSSKSEWLKTFARLYRVKAPLGDAGQHTHASQFDVLKAAVKDNCCQSLAMTQSTTGGTEDGSDTQSGMQSVSTQHRHSVHIFDENP